VRAGTSRGPTPPLLFLLLDAAEILATISIVFQSALHELNDMKFNGRKFVPEIFVRVCRDKYKNHKRGSRPRSRFAQALIAVQCLLAFEDDVEEDFC